ncbi:uncharacterized protein LOC129568186 [Sitodiplosis mosellana]|uniref:uncharacterized protein LOC129568186 n=1 Tax=Sitodiplosis mosellana TaxID=263140 RepID=UPI002443AA4B|nr:uncharacterized protein LOC129568186 [Sitodiplosis mosellana]XP_055301771.1 uncharacterized protein LOC129568186 [Sitodiplosis mosellana]
MAEQVESDQVNKESNVKQNVEQTILHRAKVIDKDLAEYQKKCKNPEKIHEIPWDKVLGYIAYMSERLTDEEGHRFSASFIGYLKLISIMVKEPPVDFCKNFNRLTKLLCNLCSKIGEQITLYDRVLKVWLELLELVPNQQKHTARLKYDKEFKMCAQSMASASSASVQHKLLDIIRAYFDEDSKDPSEWMGALFKKVPFRTNDLHDYVKIDYSSFAQKQMLIHRFNQRLQQPTVFTESARTVQIDSEIFTFENGAGFIHLNEPANTVELWVRFNGDDLKVTIRAKNIINIHIVDYGSPYAIEMVFNLNSSVRIETAQGDKANSQKLLGKNIKVKYECGFLTSQLQPLLRKMFKKEAEIISSEQMKDDSEVMEDDSEQDSDIEIVELENEVQIASATAKRIKPIEVEPTSSYASTTPVKMMKPSDFVDLVRDDSPPVVVKKEQRVPKESRVSRKQPFEPRQIEVDEVISLSNDEMDQSPKKKPIKVLADHTISTSSFYASEKKPDIHNASSSSSFPKPMTSQSNQAPEQKPTKRKAAQKAAGSIKNMADNVFDFPVESDEPKAKVKRTPRKAVPPRKFTLPPVAVASSPFKREGPKQARKLYRETDIIDVEMVEEEKPKKTNVWQSDELTGGSFRSSFNGDTQKQNKRVFDNLGRINENAAVNRQSASFSYRAASLSRKKLQSADSTIVSNESNNALVHFDGSNDENIDANSNIKSCLCGRLDAKAIDDLKTISQLTHNILSTVDTNSRQCRCTPSIGS